MVFFIVRDKEGDLWLTNTKPTKCEDFGDSMTQNI